MIEGVLIAESLREDYTLDDLNVTVRSISRWRNPAPAEGQPPVWTILTFRTAESDADELAATFGAALASPGWYVDFQDSTRKYVVFPQKVFSYPLGDDAGRAEAMRYGRSVGVPDDQLDWGETPARPSLSDERH